MLPILTLCTEALLISPFVRSYTSYKPTSIRWNLDRTSRIVLSSQGVLNKSRASQSRQGRLNSYLDNHDTNVIRSVGYFPKLSISESRRMMTALSSSPTDENSAKKDGKKSTRTGNCLYFDYNGTTPIHPRVLASMIPFLSEHFGNPSSGHAYGTAPRVAINKARLSILSLLFPDLDGDDSAIDPKSIIFTGCGTEADNLAIYLALHSSSSFPYFTENNHVNVNDGVDVNDDNDRSAKKLKKHVVTSNVEHPAVEECLKALEAKGEIEVTYVPVNNEGIVPLSSILSAIRPNQTILVTLMLANNESGALQPVKEVAMECRKRGILFHTDAAQAVGKVSVSLSEKDEDGIGAGVDMVTIVGHKFGAPKGVAALYVRPGCLSEPGRKTPDTFGGSGALLLGGGQEGGQRAGTENVPYIVGMGCAAEILMKKDSQKKEQWRKNARHMEEMRSRLLQILVEELGRDAVRTNGPEEMEKRLPNTLSVGLNNIQSGELLDQIQMDVACSAGSACHASGGKLSSVLLAMKVPLNYARGTLRLSVGPETTAEEVDAAAAIIIREAKRQHSF